MLCEMIYTKMKFVDFQNGSCLLMENNCNLKSQQRGGPIDSNLPIYTRGSSGLLALNVVGAAVELYKRKSVDYISKKCSPMCKSTYMQKSSSYSPTAATFPPCPTIIIRKQMYKIFI